MSPSFYYGLTEILLAMALLSKHFPCLRGLDSIHVTIKRGKKWLHNEKKTFHLEEDYFHQGPFIFILYKAALFLYVTFPVSCKQYQNCRTKSTEGDQVPLNKLPKPVTMPTMSCIILITGINWLTIYNSLEQYSRRKS